MAFLGDEDTAHDDDTSAGDTDAGDEGESTTDDEEDTSQNNDSKDGDDKSSDDGEGDDGKGDSKESTDTSKDDDSEEDEDDGEEPETRRPKTNAEWAAWRKSQKDKKSKDSQKKGSDDEGDEGESDEDDADDLSPEDAKAIDKRIAKAVAPFKQQAVESEVDAGISQFLNANPDFKPFEAKARRFALHPSRQNIPIKAVFYEVAGDKLLKIGADRVRQADKDARKTKTGGSSTGDDKGSKSYKDMPLSDFEKELEREKTKGR
jgi:hypothetical protein